MHTKKLLSGKTVVVTRPFPQAQKMCEALERNQAAIIHFPVLNITAVENPEPAKNTLRQLAAYDTVIFISGNAVHYAMKLAQELELSFHGKQLAAVGTATKAILEEYGYSVAITPATGSTSEASSGYSVAIAPTAGFTSEALLTHKSLQQVAGQKILIVRGMGGRERLRQQLESRGAQVDYAEVYQRQLPMQRNTIDLSELPDKDTAILIYSAESAQNLWSLCTTDEKKWLAGVTLIAGSERIAKAAISVGFANNFIIAENPSDETMLHTLTDWASMWNNDARR